MRKIMIDLNIVLDVIQKREPHHHASAQVLAKTRKKEIQGILPSHALTTIHYIIAKYKDTTTAGKVIDWLLASFEIAPIGKNIFLQARTLKVSDFEDSVVASAADSFDCQAIVTRNVVDFTNSPLPSLTPEEFLADDLFVGD